MIDKNEYERNRKSNMDHTVKQGSHSSWKIIEIQICFKIMEKSLNFMKNSWNL